MVMEGTILGHIIYKVALEIDQAKIEVIEMLAPPPTSKE